MCRMDCKPSVSGLKTIRDASAPVGGACVGAQCANPRHYAEQTADDLLEILIFYSARIKPEMLSDRGPNALKILLRRRIEPFICNVDLAH